MGGARAAAAFKLSSVCCWSANLPLCTAAHGGRPCWGSQVTLSLPGCTQSWSERGQWAAPAGLRPGSLLLPCSGSTSPQHLSPGRTSRPRSQTQAETQLRRLQSPRWTVHAVRPEACLRPVLTAEKRRCQGSCEVVSTVRCIMVAVLHVGVALPGCLLSAHCDEPASAAVLQWLPELGGPRSRGSGLLPSRLQGHTQGTLPFQRAFGEEHGASYRPLGCRDPSWVVCATAASAADRRARFHLPSPVTRGYQ